jgi:hypothetical protein
MGKIRFVVFQLIIALTIANHNQLGLSETIHSRKIHFSTRESPLVFT